MMINKAMEDLKMKCKFYFREDEFCEVGMPTTALYKRLICLRNPVKCPVYLSKQKEVVEIVT